MAVMCSQNLIAPIHELSNVFALSSSIEILSRSVRRSLHCNFVRGGGDEWKSRIGYCGFYKSHQDSSKTPRGRLSSTTSGGSTVICRLSAE